LAATAPLNQPAFTGPAACPQAARRRPARPTALAFTVTSLSTWPCYDAAMDELALSLRVAKLERANRRLTMLALLPAIGLTWVLTASAVHQAPQAKKIEVDEVVAKKVTAESIEVSRADASNRFCLIGPKSLHLQGADHAIRLETVFGYGAIELSSNKNPGRKIALYMQDDPEDSRNYLVIKDKDKPRLTVGRTCTMAAGGDGVTQWSEGNVIFYGSDGKVSSVIDR